jgi:hypothetical protein
MESNAVLLTEERRIKLKYVKSGTHRAMLIRRAKIILALDRSGKKIICGLVGYMKQMNFRVRH